MIVNNIIDNTFDLVVGTNTTDNLVNDDKPFLYLVASDIPDILIRWYERTEEYEKCQMIIDHIKKYGYHSTSITKLNDEEFYRHIEISRTLKNYGLLR